MPELHGNELKLDFTAPNAKTSMQGQTPAQVAIFGNAFRNLDTQLVTGNGGLTSLLRDNQTGSMWHWRKVRQMRRHPTIKLVRTLTVAGQAGAKWSVVADDDAPEGGKDLVTKLLKMQTHIMGSGFRGMFDFGWQPYEIVWTYDTDENKIVVGHLKPLLQDMTEIVVEAKTGKYAGFKQFSTFLAKQNSLLLNQEVEGTYWYGEGIMPSIEPAYDRWLVTDRSNVVYDKKISGAHWVIHYPPGTSVVSGEDVDNYDLAVRILAGLEGSGSFVVPSVVTSFVSDLNTAGTNSQDAWKVELISSPGAQAEFQARLAYLDTLMVRAAGFPERAILEGQYGTKAEAGEHADFAVANMDFRNKVAANQINEQLTDRLLIMNFGQATKGKVRIEIAPTADDTKDLLKQLYLQLLGGNSGAMETPHIDMQAIRDTLNVPSLARDDEDDSGNQAMLQQMLANVQQQPEQDLGQQLPGQPAQQGQTPSFIKRPE
jgi:hypothetical protein